MMMTRCCGLRSMDVLVVVCITLYSIIITSIGDGCHSRYVTTAEDNNYRPRRRRRQRTDPTIESVTTGSDRSTESMLTETNNNDHEEIMMTTTTTTTTKKKKKPTTKEITKRNNNHDPYPADGRVTPYATDGVDTTSIVSQSQQEKDESSFQPNFLSSTSPIISTIDRFLKHILSLERVLKRRKEREVETRNDNHYETTTPPYNYWPDRTEWPDDVREDTIEMTKAGSAHRKGFSSSSSSSGLGGIPPTSQSSTSSSSSSVPPHQHHDYDNYGGLYNFRYRFARACTGEDECEIQQRRQQEQPTKDDGTVSDVLMMTSPPRYPQTQPGMILQIFQRTERKGSSSPLNQDDDVTNNHNNDWSSNRKTDNDIDRRYGDGGWLEISDQESVQSSSSSSASSSYGTDNDRVDEEGYDFGHQCYIYGGDRPEISHLSSSPFEFDRAYWLEEPLHLELGVVPRHYMDFAYTPVMPREWSGVGGDEGGKCPNGMGDCSDPRTAHQSTGSSNSGDIQFETQDATWDEGSSSGLQVDGASDKVLVPSNTAHAQPLSSWWQWWFPFTSSWWQPHGSTNGDYEMGKSAFAGGSHGEVWRGRRICTRPTFLSRRRRDMDCDDKQPLVLKKLRVERGYRLLEAGLREVYFGNLIRKQIDEGRQNLFTVYVDHFFREVPRRAFGRVQTMDLELWIVFEDAGPSLRSYMYTAIVSGGFIMYQQSRLWTQLRTVRQSTSDHDEEDTSLVIIDENVAQPERKTNKTTTTSDRRQKNKMQLLGKNMMRNVLHQLLSATAALHEKGIVHRDIKPANIMCKSDVNIDDLHELRKTPDFNCRLGDFSSGWDPYTAGHLYTKGPSPGEQTDEYAPPESFIGRNWVAFDKNKPQSYDSWSIGVTALEMLLGSPNVFTVDQRTNALLTGKMKRAGASDEEIAHALYLAALSNFCIYVPSKNPSKTQSWPLRYGDPLHKTAMVKESCTLQDFHRALRARDPLGLGFSGNDLLLHLIWQLLAWDPDERMTPEEALHHPYFVSPDGTLESLNLVAGIHNALESQMLDPRLDFKVEDDVESFVCPKCGKTFHDWKSCHQHSNIRRHAKFCTYDRSNLPTCINTHSMLPAHPTSGYCDLQGRRATIEDFHSIHLHPSHQFYGIFDGHAGNLASKFVAGALYETLINYLPNLNKCPVRESQTSSEVQSGDNITPQLTWKDDIRANITIAFEDLHERFLETVVLAMPAPPPNHVTRNKTSNGPSTASPPPNMDQSGTTATVLLVTDSIIVVAGLGDSRAVLSSFRDDDNTTISGTDRNTRAWRDFPSVVAIQLTIDHVASDPAECDLVIAKGGSVMTKATTVGAIPRVNGSLAITRSIGDASLSPVLSREPYVISLDREELRDWCGRLGNNGESWWGDDVVEFSQIPCFVVLASDGLWDVMSNQEAVDMVVDVILQKRTLMFNDTSLPGRSEGEGGVFQEAAERLAVEAYVRGSTDNIGVCVVAVS